MNNLISLICGILPEILFITFFLIYSKNLKEKKLKLFLLIGLAYMLCITILRYKILFYFGFIFLGYLILKLLYKEKIQIIDVFLFGLSNFYLALSSFISFLFVNNDLSNYYIVFIFSRILLIIPFIFRNKFNKLYKSYFKLWNRNDKIKNRPVKSITLRNISVIILNLFVFFINYCIIICSNYMLK